MKPKCSKCTFSIGCIGVLSTRYIDMLAATFLCVYGVFMLFTNGPSKSYMFLLDLNFIRLF